VEALEGINEIGQDSTKHVHKITIKQYCDRAILLKVRSWHTVARCGGKGVKERYGGRRVRRAHVLFAGFWRRRGKLLFL